MKSFLQKFSPFIKYCIVGLSGTCIDVVSLYFFIEYLYLPLLLATSLSFLLAVINNFIFNKIWTFKNSSSNYRKLFIKFLLVSCGGLILTNICMFIQVEILGIWYISAKLITSVLVVLWNFLANKYWTFSHAITKHSNRKSLEYDLSIVVPAYNEELRIEHTLNEITKFCNQQNINYEILVVDDGSCDNTTTIVKASAQSDKRIKLVELEENLGKGHAVKKGVEHSLGKYILFVDADNATPIEEYLILKGEMDERACDIAIGSRYLKESQIKVKQSLFRIFVGRFGNFLIRSFIIDGIKDTQCGFKLFKYDVAQDVFYKSRIKRWGFDMEVLAIASSKGYLIRECPVKWYHTPGSRLRPIKDSISTFIELIFIKIYLLCGAYDE